MSAITILLLGGVVVFWRRSKSDQRTLQFGALFSLPLVIVEFWLTGGLDRLGATVLQQIVQAITVMVAMMSVGALAAVVADRGTRRWWGSVAHPARYRLWWLTLGLLVSAALFFTGESAPEALMIGLAINAVLLVTVERALIWDAVLGSGAFVVLFLALDLVFGIRASGDIAHLLIGSTAIGLTVFGLPLERLLTIALLGAQIGPLFSATKFRRSPTVLRQPTISSAKMVVVIALIVVMTGSIAVAAPQYILPPSVQTITPANGAANVTTSTTIDIQFNRPITRQTLRLDITPAVDGNWTFDQQQGDDHIFHRAHFTFDEALPAGMTFHVRLTGIQSIWRFNAPEYAWQFTTAAAPVPVVPVPVVPIPTPVVIVPPAPTPVPVVPIVPSVTPAPTPPAAVPTSHLISVSEDYQDQALSCEAAALKMALSAKGAKVSETQIMKIVGYDPTPHQGGVWGDPNVAFVGNIAGHQDTTGYGVYWNPIAKAANTWRPSSVITNGTVQQLAAEIYADHPVVIWGTLGNAYRDDWKTPAGKTIVSWKGEHARTVIGVNGSADNPTSFVLNDPVVGRITWSAATLDANWARFNRSGVIVR